MPGGVAGADGHEAELLPSGGTEEWVREFLCQRKKGLGAARQQRRRANFTEEEKEAERKSNAARVCAERASPEYQVLSPEEKHRRKGRPGVPLRLQPFVGVDGEGGYRHTDACALIPGRCDCRQEYAALTVGDQTLCNAEGSRLTTWQVLDFLVKKPRYRRYVGFYIGYDVWHWLLDIPENKLRQIARPETSARKPFTYVSDPDTGVTYGIVYIPQKLFVLTRCGDPVLDEQERMQRTAAGKILRLKGTGRRLKLYDVSGYFQTKFAKAIADWHIGTAAERELIDEGKTGRADFSLPLPPEVMTYNRLECKLLAELMTKLVRTAEDVLGIELRKYNGAGTLADALLDKFRIADYQEDFS